MPYIHPHSLQWKRTFEAESDHIHKQVTIEIDLIHIGSTAVPGLMAKDCIDILGVVSQFDDGFKLNESLAKMGYESRGEYGIEGRHYFVKYKPQKIHLHVFAVGNVNIEKHLLFVKTLEDSPDRIKEFNQLKLDLLNQFPDNPKQYQKHKSSFYQSILNHES
jgi:GrpB-like predicted nucleotidyltransferase (UPF0157 family)